MEGIKASEDTVKRVQVDFPLGYKKDNFLTRDLKSACIYVAAELAPRLRIQLGLAVDGKPNTRVPELFQSWLPALVRNLQ